MRSKECSGSRSDKNDEPVFGTDRIAALLSQKHVIPITYKVGQRFTHQVNRYR